MKAERLTQISMAKWYEQNMANGYKNNVFLKCGKCGKACRINKVAIKWLVICECGTKLVIEGEKTDKAKKMSYTEYRLMHDAHGRIKQKGKNSNPAREIE